MGVEIYAGPGKEQPGQVLMELTTTPYGDQQEFLGWMASVRRQR